VPSGTPPLYFFQQAPPHIIFQSLEASILHRIRTSHSFEHVSHGFLPTEASCMPVRNARFFRWSCFFNLFLSVLSACFCSLRVSGWSKSTKVFGGLTRSSSSSSCWPKPLATRRLALLLSVLHLLLHVVTSSQQRSHFFRQVNGRLQVTQTLLWTCLPRSRTVFTTFMVENSAGDKGVGM
jgi:hypothetical protein